MDFETFQHTQKIIEIETPHEFHHTFNTIQALNMCASIMEDGSGFAEKIARMAHHYGAPMEHLAPMTIDEAHREILHIAKGNVWSDFEDGKIRAHGVEVAALQLTALYNCLATQIQVSLQANEPV